MNEVVLVVDDMRTLQFQADWLPLSTRVYHARTSEEGIEALKVLGERVDSIWLDHDLGGEDTGMKVADYLIESYQEREDGQFKVYIHSSNGPASENMKSKLHNAGYSAVRIDLATPRMKRIVSVKMQDPDTILLTPEGTEKFIEAIENPPEPNDNLKRFRDE